jgi:hypothetical protein
MTTSAQLELNEIAVLRSQNAFTRYAVNKNIEGVGHAESLIQPQAAGNCMNWIVGHLICVYGKVLPQLGQTSVIEPEKLAPYDRGSAPLNEIDALEFGSLVGAWDETCNRMDAGLATLTAEVLNERAPFSPANDPNETVRSLMGTVLFHQAYHAGQTGILRRVVGKAGAIK